MSQGFYATRKPYQKATGGKREDLGGTYFRSAWEANWARYLNLLKKTGEIQGWEYEPDEFEFHRIKRGSRFYKPDFKVINRDGSIEYHEVKGYMTQKSMTKLKRMEKYYPEVKVVLVDVKHYVKVAKAVSGIIDGWEFPSKEMI